MAYNVHVVALPMYVGTWAIIESKIEISDTCSFQDALNNSSEKWEMLHKFSWLNA